MNDSADTPTNTHWHLLGAGNMGTLAASRLLRAGHRVTALHPTAAVIERTLRRPGQADENLTLPVDPDGPVQHLLLALKGPQTQTALANLLPRLAPDATLLCLQNGMGTLDDVPLPTTCRVLHAVTTDGAWRDGQVIHVVAENSTAVGGIERMPAALESLPSSWPGWQWQPDIAAAQWRKLAINAVINPLTALYDCRNGELLDGGVRQAHLGWLAEEVDRVLPHWLPDWPGGTTASAETVAQQTAGNTSSMRADWQAGRETEIDFINGYLVRQARNHGIALPEHEAVLEKLSWQQN